MNYKKNVPIEKDDFYHLVTRFMVASKGNIDEILPYSLEVLMDLFSVSRAYVYLYLFQDNKMELKAVKTSSKSSDDELINEVKLSDYTDVWVKLHLNHQPYKVDEIDVETKEILRDLINSDTKSILYLPIFLQKDCIGFVGFESVTPHKDWTEFRDLIQIIPELYASFFSRHFMLEELEEARIIAQTANSIKTDFLAKVTHEIRTPLHGITNAIYLLEDTEMDEEQRDILGILHTSHDTLSTLVDNILNYSKLDSNELRHNPKEVVLEEEIIKTLDVYRYMASNKELGLYLNYDYEIPKKVSVDIEKVNQVLSNLIQNAIKFTNYGYVELKIQTLQLHYPYIDIRFEVSDTGVGIEQEHLNDIFSEFYQVGDSLSQSIQGTGLGLTIANEIIHFLDGELQVQSIVRKGTTFSFDLTFFTPQEQPVNQILPLEAVIITQEQLKHTNIHDMLQKEFMNVDVLTLEQYQKQDKKYAVVFVHVIDNRIFSRNIQLIRQLMLDLEPDSKRIMLVEGLKTPLIQDSADFVDQTFYLPATSKVIMGYLRRDRTITNLILQQDKDGKDATASKNILLVDDNTINRKIMAKLLQNMGHIVAQAKHGFEAIEMVQTNKYDMILMDILMPGIDGYETTRRIREMDTISSAVPVIAVTANDIESTKKLAYDSGMNGVLTKPLQKDDLNSLFSDYFKTKKVKSVQLSKEPDMNIFNIAEFEELYEHKSTRIELLEAFLEEEKEDTNRIRRAFENKDVDDIYKELHYLKGTYAYLKANRIYHLTQTILDLCKQKMLEELLVLEEPYMQNYHHLIKTLKEYLNTI